MYTIIFNILIFLYKFTDQIFIKMFKKSILIEMKKIRG